jgi:hypothetical protein
MRQRERFEAAAAHVERCGQIACRIVGLRARGFAHLSSPALCACHL